MPMGTTKFDHMVQVFERSLELYGPRDLFGVKRNGSWTWLSYHQFGRLVDKFRAGLASLGVQRGDRVAIISNNRVEWAVAAYACYGLGAALVPMYEAQHAKEWAYILGDSEAVAVIAATNEIAAACREIKDKTPTLKHIIGLSSPKSDPLSYEALLAVGEKNPVPSIKATSDDIACLIYTSGTTGNPKGVILSQGNLVSNLNGVHVLFELDPNERTLSFLPWAHAFGQTCELHWVISMGASTALCESVDKLLANLAEVRPTVLLSVPRIFNRIYDGVTKQMKESPAPVRRLFYAGLAAATKKNKGEELGLVERLTLAVADRVVFSKIRAKFGGRLRYAVSGAAALSRDIAEFIDALGILVFEGYGLTETSPLVSASYPGARRIGSVGKPIPGVKVVIDKSESNDPKQGELIIYGENVMKGYHHRDEETKAAFTSDGGLRTGDLGYIDEDGFLYITGRIKEQYKLENGKFVAPAPLEEQLKLSPYIANVMVYGDNRLFNVALVVPDFEAVKKWAAGAGLSFSSSEAMVKSPQVIAHLQAEIDKHSADFKNYEKIKKITLAPEDFTIENGMLTPTLKLKRRVAWQKYQAQIEALYASAVKDDKRATAAA